MTSLIKVPFASSGDKTAVPDTDSTGSVNMTQGYGQAYSLDPATDPSAKRIEREKMNWLFNRITQAINEIQVSGVTPFINSSDNDGSPFSYGKGAIVSIGGSVYQSLVAANTSTPPSSDWSLLPEKIQPLDATLTALSSLVGSADKVPYFTGDDTAGLTALTSTGRSIIGQSSVATLLSFMGLSGLGDYFSATAGTDAGLTTTTANFTMTPKSNGVIYVVAPVYGTNVITSFTLTATGGTVGYFTSQFFSSGTGVAAIVVTKGTACTVRGTITQGTAGGLKISMGAIFMPSVA